jgi:hypothetical protein
MCRSIKTLRGTPATDDDVQAAALQFVRKVSGYRQPSQRNAEAFGRAVDEIAAASRRMLAELEVGSGARESGRAAPRRDRGR